MISKIGVEDRKFKGVNKVPCLNSNSKTVIGAGVNVSSLNSNSPSNIPNQSPSFKGGLWNVALSGMQACERNPMVNVAVIDLFSAILPRTFVESLTNWFAGFEALRRESSGLIVNCMIPSAIALGFASAMNKYVMPKGSNMASCWADSSLIQKATDIYSKSNSEDKIKDTLKEIIKGIEGTHGESHVKFSEVLTPQEIEEYASRLKTLTTAHKSKKEFNEAIAKITKELSEKTHVFEGVNVGNVKATTTTTLLEDSVKYFREFQKAPKGTTIAEFAKKSKKLVTTKSALGLAVILPLAASMQYINRWITEKSSGVKGAPIYDDFGKDQDEEIRAKAKEGLFKQKLISISSMIGVALLSMMKKPTWGMLEFKGKFPTMDQARIISTTTFASRMAAADDKNELAEATVRDIATFCSMYFLGDYVSKAIATLLQKKTGVILLNDTKKLKGNENIFKKFWHWVKDVNVKSTEEVVSKTAEALKAKGITPNAEQKKVIEKELKRAINMRSACQAGNLGVSLLLLGLIIPIFTRKNTQKKHAEALKLAHENSSGTGSTTNVTTDFGTTSTKGDETNVGLSNKTIVPETKFTTTQNVA